MPPDANARPPSPGEHVSNLRVCLDCGQVAEGSRCPPCQAARDQRVSIQRGGANVRGYGRAWEKQSARVRREHPCCAVCGTTDDLTGDHVIAKANGGTDDLDNLGTLCRTHNGAKGRR